MDNKELAKRISSDIDMWCLKELSSDFRWHLGASLIGKPCSRYLWYSFRWVKREIFPAATLRLFDRGHREEPAMTRMLRGIGCQVWDVDTSQAPNEQGEYPQFKVSGVQGHFGGSLDAIVLLPERYNVPEPMSFSYKTNGTGTGFTNLFNKGLLLSKPIHHEQESVYCWKRSLKKYGYMNANKNDDQLFIDVQDADWNAAQRSEQKAERIIFSREPPTKLAENPSYHECTMCKMSQVCHEGLQPEKNCRSCKNARPVENTEWMCDRYCSIIPKEFVKTGCDVWEPIVN
jgi:hypothetical protein